MPKIAAIQLTSSPHLDDNLTESAKWISEAAKRGAALVVLPENVAMMEASPDAKRSIAETWGDGRIQAFFSAQAKKFGIWVVAGTIHLRGDDPSKTRAASIVYNADGEAVARYDKIHLFNAAISAEERYAESDLTEAGSEVVVVETPVGKMGMAVCFDVRFPELFRALRDQGAELFVLPSAFTVKTGEAHWEVLTRCRAIENFCYLVGACQGGSHANGRKTFGNSLIIEPWGGVVARLGSEGAGVIVAELDLEKVRVARRMVSIA